MASGFWRVATMGCGQSKAAQVGVHDVGAGVSGSETSPPAHATARRPSGESVESLITDADMVNWLRARVAVREQQAQTLKEQAQNLERIMSGASGASGRRSHRGAGRKKHAPKRS